MPLSFNVFRILGDVSHTVSKGILIWAIHSNRSAEGVSLITQVFYALVFCTRYIDLFWTGLGEWHHVWNFVLKLFYIISSLYIVFLMQRVYARTRELEKSWKLGIFCLLGSLVGTPFICWIFYPWLRSGFTEVLWVFSIILESVCVLPQLLLLRQTTVPTVIDSFYLVTLGSYRFFYILNWIIRGVQEKGYVDPTSWTFGIIQTLLYLDFAWVYWTRQRVKLRHGGVVDSDDLNRGWVIGRLLGRKSLEQDDDVGPDPEAQNGQAKRSGRWGARGVSVSADDGVRTQDAESQPLAEPDAFEDDDSEDEGRSATKNASAETAGTVGNGAEWREPQSRQ